MRRQRLLVGLMLILISVSFFALGESRIALVVSKASYLSEIGALANSHKDGAVIAAALETVGFEKRNVAVLRDADQPTMRLAIADFIERIEKADSKYRRLPLLLRPRFGESHRAGRELSDTHWRENNGGQAAPYSWHRSHRNHQGAGACSARKVQGFNVQALTSERTNSKPSATSQLAHCLK
jgi:hypothetical protein